MNAPMTDFAIVGGCLVLTLALVALLFIRSTVKAIIEGFSWKRKIILEHFIWVEESSYMSPPPGSRNRRTITERYQSYQEIGSRTNTTTVNGIPTQTRQPIYGWVPRSQKKYLYQVQRWVKSREVFAEGNDRHASWPAYTLATEPLERVYDRLESYQVTFQTEKGKRYRPMLPEKDWLSLDDQVPYTLLLTLFGAIRDFTPITAPQPSGTQR